MPFYPNPDGTWREVQEDSDMVIRRDIPHKAVTESAKQVARATVVATLAASGPDDRLVRRWNSAMECLGRHDQKV